MTKIKNTPEMTKWLKENGVSVEDRDNAYTPETIKFFQDQSDYAEMVEDTVGDPLFNSDGSNEYVTSGSIEDIPYDDLDDIYNP